MKHTFIRLALAMLASFLVASPAAQAQLSNANSGCYPDRLQPCPSFGNVDHPLYPGWSYPPGSGAGSTTYLHVGNAEVILANVYNNGVFAWSAPYFTNGCNDGECQSVGTVWSSRVSNTNVNTYVAVFKRNYRQYCYWHVNVTGSDAYPTISSQIILDNGACSLF